MAVLILGDSYSFENPRAICDYIAVLADVEQIVSILPRFNAADAIQPGQH
jgi:hypothetical protein